MSAPKTFTHHFYSYKSVSGDMGSYYFALMKGLPPQILARHIFSVFAVICKADTRRVHLNLTPLGITSGGSSKSYM